MMQPTPDLPWAPARGQTALRAIERSEAFVLCEDKGNPNFRSLWYADGRLAVAPCGKATTLKGRVMKPEPEPEPDDLASGQRAPQPATNDAPPRRPVSETAAKHATAAAPKPIQMSLF